MSHREPGCIPPSIGVQICIPNGWIAFDSDRIRANNYEDGLQVTHHSVDSIAGLYIRTHLTSRIYTFFFIRLLIVNFIMSPAIKNPEPNLDISFQGNMIFLSRLICLLTTLRLPSFIQACI
jgi:hypothetical protein